MKVTFVALGQEQLAISLLSSVLKREGHTTSLAYNPALFDDRYLLDVPRLAQFFDRTDRVVDEVVEARPDLVAFSVLTPTYQWCLRVAREVKARLDVPVIFGGVHPSAVPEICLENPYVDYVCIGEGEDAIVRLCEVLPSSDRRPRASIPNLAWLDGGVYVRGEASGFLGDLDSLPFWDKALWQDHIRLGDNWLTMSSRGCPYRCTFCFNNFFAKIPGRGGGKYLRQRSVENMMQELVEGKERWGIKRVEFDDDIFTTNKAWLRDFLFEYKREIDVPFQCLVHPRYIDLDMARWLRDAGCQHVQMGIQSAADDDYKKGELLRMDKGTHVRGALAALQEGGLPTKLDHMLGLPNEPISAQEAARELYAEFPPRRISTFWLTHLPGVEITKKAVERGEISEEDYARINRGESGRFHSRSVAHASEVAVYRRYELLYRLIPLLPRFLRKRIRIRHIPNLPGPVADTAGFVLEGLSSVLQRDPEAPIYLRYYAHSMRRQLPEIIRDVISGRRPLLASPTMDAPRVVPVEPPVAVLEAETPGAVPVTLTQRTPA